MTQYWIGVASREHVLKGTSGGFCQVCHGKPGPLRLMSTGDWIIYYSPTEKFGGTEPCRRFTAIGQVKAKEPYQFCMNEDFTPWRRDVTFFPAKEAEITLLIPQLSFIYDKRRWGFPFRRGCFSIPLSDFLLIAAEMELANEKICGFL